MRSKIALVLIIALIGVAAIGLADSKRGQGNQGNNNDQGYDNDNQGNDDHDQGAGPIAGCLPPGYQCDYGYECCNGYCSGICAIIGDEQ